MLKGLRPLYLSTKSEMSREQRRERQGKGDDAEEVLLLSRLHRSFCNSCNMNTENKRTQTKASSPGLQPQCLACLARTFDKNSLREEEEVEAYLWLAQVPDPHLHPGKHDKVHWAAVTL